jgi:hypothetical protein
MASLDQRDGRVRHAGGLRHILLAQPTSQTNSAADGAESKVFHAASLDRAAWRAII